MRLFQRFKKFFYNNNKPFNIYSNFIKNCNKKNIIIDINNNNKWKTNNKLFYFFPLSIIYSFYQLIFRLFILS